MGQPSPHHAAPFAPMKRLLGYLRGRRSRDLVAASTGAALLLVIGILAGWAHHSLLTARPGDAASATRAPAAPGSVPTLEQLHEWLAQAQPSLDALLSARHDIASAAANNDIAGTGATCETAEGAVAGMQKALPSPDPALNTALQGAVSSYRVGLGYCIAGARNHGGEAISRAATYISQANDEMQTGLTVLERDLPGFKPADTAVMTV